MTIYFFRCQSSLPFIEPVAVVDGSNLFRYSQCQLLQCLCVMFVGWQRQIWTRWTFRRWWSSWVARSERWTWSWKTWTQGWPWTAWSRWTWWCAWNERRQRSTRYADNLHETFLDYSKTMRGLYLGMHLRFANVLCLEACFNFITRLLVGLPCFF